MGVIAPALNGPLWASFGATGVSQEYGAAAQAWYQDFTSGGA
jgi:hypothetical protein